MTYPALYVMMKNALSSDFEAAQLFAHVTGQKVSGLGLLRETTVSDAETDKINLLLERRKNGEPLQYMLGEWEFYGLPFKVGEGVLIPRQDTEILVERVLESCGKSSEVQVLDLCSGSGCIAIAIAKNLVKARVTALEISPLAYKYLCENILLNNVAVTAKNDALEEYVPPQPLDIITANPPYIPSCCIDTLQTEVQHEPRMALDGGSDGLYFYREISRRYRQMLKPGGEIFFEIGIGQAESVAEILDMGGYRDIQIYKDYGAVPRVITAFA